MQQLEHLVERRGVRGAGGADRVEPVQVAGDQLAGEQRLAGPHPVAVAHHGVDLAVVGDEPERVRQRPAREGVGGEPRVHDGHRGGDALVDQVGVEVVELVGGEHALVGDGARGQRREVHVGLVLGALAQAERQALEGHPDEAAAGGGDEELAEGRHHRERGGAQHGRVDRHVAPAEDGEALLGGDLLDAAAGLGDLLLPAGQERGADGVRVRLRELEVDDLAEERVREAEQDARAVTGVGLGAGRAAVLEVAERGDRLGDDVVARLAGQGGDERDTAGVVLVESVVEPLGRRERVHGPSLPSSWHPDRSAGEAVRALFHACDAGDDIGPSIEKTTAR